MPLRQHFFWSPSSELTQPILSDLLAVFPPQPSPCPQPIKQHWQEPAGSKHIVGGVNKVIVLEMFRSFRINFAQELNIIKDNKDQINKRYTYTREHKLAAIDYTLNT
jgi:hypothetical protein